MKGARMRRKPLSLAIAAALAVVSAAVEAQVQDQTPVADGNLGSVTVTATRRAEKLSDVPSSIQAFTADQLEQAGIATMQELFYQIPGASQGRAPTSGTSAFQIRGIASFFGDSTVGYYLDEVTFYIPNRSYAPVAGTFDVDRVEVQRGPQGTLYGHGAMGGSVRFITADPSLKKIQSKGEFSLSNTSGGDPNYTANVAVSAPLMEDVLGVRVTANYLHQGGWAAGPTFPDQLNENTLENIRVKVLFKPTPLWTVKLGYQHTENDDPLGNQLAALDPDRFLPSVLRGQGVPTYNTSKYDMLSAFIAYDAGIASIESATGYLYRTNVGRVPLDVGLPPNFGFPILDVSGPSDSFTTELRAVSKGTSPWRWVAGAMYMDSSNTENVLLNATPSPRPIRNGSSTIDSQSYAVFGELSYELMGGKLIPLVGLRYFHDDRKFADFDYNQPPASQAYNYGATFTATSPRFNLAYKPTPDSLYYVNIAKGFRSGTFNTQSALNFIQIPVPPAVQPDTVWSYELGTKWTPAGTGLSVDLAGYYLTWDNMQVQFQTPPPTATVIVNAGEARGYGFDYGFTWTTPVQGLSLALTGNFNRTYFEALNVPNAAQLFANTNIVVGRQLAPVPQQTATVSANYYKPMPQWGDLALGAYASYTYVGKSGDFGSIGTGPATRPAPLGDPQNLINLRLGLEGNGWSTYLFGTNLLDRDNPIYISGSGIQRNYPRTIGLEFRYSL